MNELALSHDLTLWKFDLVYLLLRKIIASVPTRLVVLKSWCETYLIV
jgi:hypothetical protein